MWEILARREPYPNLDPLNTVMQVVHEGLRLEPPLGTNPVYSQIMTSCFETDPEKRPTFKQVCDQLLPLENDPNLKLSPTFTNHSNNSNNNNNNTNQTGSKDPFEPTEYGSMDKNLDRDRLSLAISGKGKQQPPQQQQQQQQQPEEQPSSSQYQPTPFSIDEIENNNNNNNNINNESYGSLKDVKVEEESPYSISPAPQERHQYEDLPEHMD